MNGDDRSSSRASPPDFSEAEPRGPLLDPQTLPAGDGSPRSDSPSTPARRRAGQLYLEDFFAGQRFRSGSVVLNADDIKQFAAHFDPQPFHLDDAEAARSFFGGLVASGWHTAAMSMRLLVDSDMQIAGGLVGLGGELSWPRPVLPGDEVHVDVEVLEVRPSRSKPDSGIVKARNRTVNQRGEAVQVAIVNMLVPRKPS